jgi:hypothetical protein
MRACGPHPDPDKLELSDQENDMRSKLLGGVAALALTACTVLASTAPASAWGWRHGGYGYGRGYGWGGPGVVAAGIVGGAFAAATSPLWAPGYYGNSPGYAYGNSGYYDYSPGYAYGPSNGYVAAPVMVAGDSVAYCQQRFRSYNPSTGMYLGFDGQYHPCP